MDEERLKELMRSPLDDVAVRRRPRWLPVLVALGVFAAVLAVLGAAAFVRTGSGNAQAPGRVDEAVGVPAPADTLPGEPGYPEAALHHQLVYDPTTDRVIAVGGTAIAQSGRFQSGAPVQGTWGYDPAAGDWFEYPTAPPARSLYAIARDDVTGMIVLFGGTPSAVRVCGVFGPCAPESLGDTWLLDPGTGVWDEAMPSTGPTPRYGAAMAQDHQTGRLILFGGAVMADRTFQNDPLGDTWAYDAAANSWTELAAANPPPARAGHRMVWDPASRRILMFGGSGGGDLDSRVWAYDGAANRWEPSGAEGPLGRWTPVMAFDTTAGELLMIGGQGPVDRVIGEGVTATDISSQGDAWAYRNGAWAPIEPIEFEGQEIVTGASSGVFVPGSNRVVVLLFGTTAVWDRTTGEWTFTDPPSTEG